MTSDNTATIKLSIVISVYNTENYLRKCLDSISSEKIDLYEVVCINDGSNDGSEEILREYEETDSRISVYSYKRNRGLSFARNAGVRHSKGEYIWFVDSDDYVNTGAVSEILALLTEEELDGVLFDCTYKCEGDINLGYKAERTSKYQGIFDGRVLTRKLLENDDYDVSSCRQCWRKDYLLKNDLKFYEGVIHEDILFSFEAILNADRLLVVNKPFYSYVRRSGTITTNRNLEVAIKSYVIIVCECMKICDAYSFGGALSLEIGKYLNKRLDEVRKMGIRYLWDGGNITSIRYDDDMYKRLQDDIFIISGINILKLIEFLRKYKGSIPVVYGAGMIARRVISVFSIIGVDDFEVAVTSGEGGRICGIPIVSINDLMCDVNNRCFIISSNNTNRIEMIDYLKKHKIFHYFTI